MKKKLFILGMVMVMVFSTMSTAFAGVEKEDITKGVLVSVERIDNEDGSYSIEKTYIKKNMNPFSYNNSKAIKTSGTDIFTKEKDTVTNGITVASYKVTATFDWDSVTKKVKVYDAIGKITHSQGKPKIVNKKTEYSGNNTKKASAEFSFGRENSLGFTQNYSVKCSCDYKGKNS